jgi:ABC-type dipeptide/oligopeptide/nickel transport system permease subunit
VDNARGTGIGERPQRDALFARTGRWLVLLWHANKIGAIGAAVVALFIFMAIFAPFITRYGPNEQHIMDQLQAPSLTYWLGTDNVGRDTYTRIVYGSRISLFVSIGSVLVACLVGVIGGAVAGYYRGWLDGTIMRLVDVVISFPSIILAIAVLGFIGRGSVNLVVALAFAFAPVFVRITRSSVLRAREEDYVTAAIMVGKSDVRIIFRDILPNALTPVVVQATLALAAAILAESGLSFVGLGPPPPSPSWGRMLSEMRVFMNLSPWVVIVPGVTIMLAVMGFNFLGDGLRDLLDPRSRRFLEQTGS